MNDLIERYVYAATKRLPGKTRDDVAQEIRTLIDDMLDERCKGSTPAEKDIRVVLTEIGTPQELYEKYDENGTKAFIGAPYYSTYTLVLKIVLSCVVFGLTVANLCMLFMNPDIMWYERLASYFGEICFGLTGAFTCITVSFAICSYKGIKLDTYTDLNDLPEVPKKKEVITRAECIFGIVFGALFTTIFILAPGIFCVAITEDHRLIPIFTEDIIRGSWVIIIIMGLCGISNEIVRLLEGRYNIKVLISTVVFDMISAVLTVALFQTRDLFNPEFIRLMIKAVGPENSFIVQVLSNIPTYLTGIIIFAFVLDIVTVTVSTLTSRK